MVKIDIEGFESNLFAANTGWNFLVSERWGEGWELPLGRPTF